MGDLAPLPDVPPWEPPLAGSEVEHLLGSLDRLRATFRWKAGGLDSTGLTTKLPSSDLTLGGLLKHLAFVEDHSSTMRLTGEAPGEPWQSVDWAADPDWEFTSSAGDSPEELYALYDGAVERWRARVGAALDAGGLGQPIELNWDGHHLSLRRMIFDLVEEYGRHTGHADLLRESIDGVVGEDPPWSPAAIGIQDETSVLAAVSGLARALDGDDFDRVIRCLDPDVEYEIGGVTHRGADAVVESYRTGSASAREIFDRVEFHHSIIGLIGDRTVRVDFSDRLTADGEVFEHHSIQDITVDRAGRVTHVVDRHVEGQASRLDEFMSRHHRVRPPSRHDP